MKNRLLAAAGAALLTFSLAACGAESTSESGAAQSADQSSSAQSAEQQSAAAAADEQPEVDRDPKEPLPEIEFSKDGVPSMTPLDATPPDVITVKTLVKGEGTEVGPDDTVQVNYAGFLWDDGTEFDSSFSRDAAATFSLNGVISGWKWGLAGTRVGDTVQIVVPSEYGYGEQGTQGIPPNATLVFVVEVLDVFSVDPAILKEATVTENQLPDGLEINGELGEVPSFAFAASAKVPKKASAIVLAEGTGRVITDKDTVIAQVTAVNWGAPDSLQTTWGQAPQQIAQAPQELLGMKVGSRVALLVPGSGELDSAGVFVVDVLAAFPS